MILRDFNNGWGDNVELRQFELGVLKKYIADWFNDCARNIMINSTWYTKDYHVRVLEYLEKNPTDGIVLYSFMDPAIPRPEWFNHTNASIRCVGYYPGADEIDAWALIVDQYLQLPTNTTDSVNLDIPFLCYNRKPHWHRQRLVRQLTAKDCTKHGVVTLGSKLGSAVLRIENDVKGSSLAPNPGVEHYGIENDIMSLGPIQIWDRCFLNVVTETVFDVDSQWFVSEKIYKPVVGLRPFLVYAPGGARIWLQHIGIEPYLRDFADITDFDLGDPENLAQFLVILSTKDSRYFHFKYQQLKEKIYHNKRMFDLHVVEIKRRIWLP